MRAIVRPGLMGVVAALVAGLAAPAVAQTKVVIGHVSKTVTYWPWLVAEQKGLFKAENLDVENVIVSNAAAVGQQVVAGSLDLGNTTFEIDIQAVENGAPISLIASTDIKYAYSMYGAKDVHSAAELKGRSAMVPVPKNDIANFFNAWLKANGMTPADVDIIYNGSSPARFAALQSGGVGAVALAPPLDFAADAAGFHKLVDFAQFVKAYGFLGMLGRKDWLAAHRPATEAVIRAVSKATDWLYDPANREEAVAMLMRETKQDHDITEKTYDYVVRDTQAFSRGLAVPDADFLNVLKAFQEMGVVKDVNAPIDRYVDRSFLGK